jgi:hypothetical protein
VTGGDGDRTEGAVEVARPAGGRDRVRERARARLDVGVGELSTGARERPRAGSGAPVTFASRFSRRAFVRFVPGLTVAFIFQSAAILILWHQRTYKSTLSFSSCIRCTSCPQNRHTPTVRAQREGACI